MFVLKFGPRTERHEDMLNLSRDYRVEGILKRVLSLGLANHYATL